ncbi:MAG: glutathione peroxidase, partial [Atopobium sp.]|nr:glutathione peroxidase [Atopobium sp.]
MANTNIYDLSVEERDGSVTSLSSFDGKVLLIVNTAT